MTDISGYPPLNLEELRWLVKWAEYESERSDQVSEWNQNLWAGGLKLTGDPFTADTAESVAWFARAGDWLLAEPRCGSAFCVAGNAIVRAGYRLVVATTAYNDTEGWGNTADYAIGPDGTIRPIEVLARDLLGLTQSEAEWLFDGDNDVETIREAAETIAESRGLTL